ncbi:nicotinamide riboside transporter PnuC [Pararcticibacter amylolyticus]|uniref:Nicotinamide riboside transporter PnuC n=1 Tax=Pararcticibacter amylolyticus TaxID=2173175 RepID=A0A2U2PGN5_9SPHI|nr:nicotinamide riboside transporter PnuC [Pararcticibacter amylolyticus]PWG80289.1 nicotinamide riboside transporter PnuC [Pararcticibacter amylolyticus]
MSVFFDIESIAFNIWNYPLSYVELIGTLFGLLSVFYASKANILTWPSGVINELFLFILFFQVQLYADMFLQVYFFIVTLYGWFHWNSKTTESRITTLRRKSLVITIFLILLLSLPAGFMVQNLHVYMPQHFKMPAAFPYVDSLVMVGSIAATLLLSRKRLDNWYFWIAIDLICVVLYSVKGIYFLALEYLVFLGMAIYGLLYWKKQVSND